MLGCLGFCKKTLGTGLQYTGRALHYGGHLLVEGASYFLEGFGWTLGVIVANEVLGLEPSAINYALKSGVAGGSASSVSGTTSLLISSVRKCANHKAILRKGPTQWGYSFVGTFASNALWQLFYDIAREYIDNPFLRAFLIGLSTGSTFFVTVIISRAVVNCYSRENLIASIKSNARNDFEGALCSFGTGGAFTYSDDGGRKTVTDYLDEPSSLLMALEDLGKSGSFTAIGYVSADLSIEAIRGLYRGGSALFAKCRSKGPEGLPLITPAPSEQSLSA
jgi:hypothetical protein